MRTGPSTSPGTVRGIRGAEASSAGITVGVVVGVGKYAGDEPCRCWWASTIMSSMVSSTLEGRRARDPASITPDGRSPGRDGEDGERPVASASRAWNSVGGSHFTVAAVGGRCPVSTALPFALGALAGVGGVIRAARSGASSSCRVRSTGGSFIAAGGRVSSGRENSSGESPDSFAASKIACPNARASGSRLAGSLARLAITTSASGSGTWAARGIERSCGAGSWICWTSRPTA